MSNNYFSFKKFTIHQDKSAFKVGTDGVLLGACADLKGTERVLDAGAGTGLITLMIAQRCNALIVALEPDSDSFTECSYNVGLSPWKERITVMNMKLQDYTDSNGFDLMVTNPPYFVDSLKNPDPRKSASRHNDSLTTQELLSSASRLLKENGKLQLVLPYTEGNIFIAEASDFGLFCNSILKIRPLPTSEIRRMIITMSRQRTRVSEKFLTIEHGKRHEFTEDYISLTRDFYLKF